MTHLNRRKALALMGGTVAAAGLAAPAYAQNKTIKVGALRFTSHSASFIALERGYFAEVSVDHKSADSEHKLADLPVWLAFKTNLRLKSR